MPRVVVRESGLGPRHLSPFSGSATALLPSLGQASADCVPQFPHLQNKDSNPVLEVLWLQSTAPSCLLACDAQSWLPPGDGGGKREKKPVGSRDPSKPRADVQLMQPTAALQSIARPPSPAQPAASPGSILAGAACPRVPWERARTAYLEPDSC